MALRDLSFIKYIEAAFRHKLFKDKDATYFNYLGFNLPYKSGGGKKGIFEYARKVLPFAYTNEFADSDEGNLQMAKAVIEKLDKEGKALDLFIEPSQIPPEYDLIVADAKTESQQPEALQTAQPAAGEPAGTMLGGIPSVGVQGGMRTIRVPQTKPPAETAEEPQSKLYVADKTGRIVEERTITPISTTVAKPEAQSKLFIADKSGRVVGERVIKNVGSGAQIGVKKGLTRVGGGFRNILGGIGRGGIGLLGGAGSGGVRFFTRVGLGGADALVGFSNQISRGSIMKGPPKKVWLILLGAFLLVGVLAAFAPAQAPDQQPVTQLPPVTGGICPNQAAIDANKKDPNTCRYFNLGVNIFDSNIPQSAIDTYISSYSNIFVSAGRGDINEFRKRVDYIVAKSKEVGLSPVLGLGYWKTESNFSTQGTRDLGCHESAVNFYEQVDCKLGIGEFSDPRKNPITNCARSKDTNGVACNALKDVRRVLDQTNPIKYPISTFDDFAESYGSRAPNLNQDGSVNNNCISTYNKLVEVAKELSACKVSAAPPPRPGVPSGPLGFSITCPLASGPASGFRIICGTATNSRSGCGHGVTGYPTRCNPVVYVCDTTSTQYSDGTYALYPPALYNAVDVRPASGNGSGSPIYLPFLDGNQSVNWARVDGPTSLKGGEWGVKIVYEADYNGKKLRLDLTHLNQGVDLNSPLRSGHQVGILKPGLDRDGGGHLHTSMAVDGVWKDGISESYLCSNRPS